LLHPGHLTGYFFQPFRGLGNQPGLAFQVIKHKRGRTTSRERYRQPFSIIGQDQALLDLASKFITKVYKPAPTKRESRNWPCA